MIKCPLYICKSPEAILLSTLVLWLCLCFHFTIGPLFWCKILEGEKTENNKKYMFQVWNACKCHIFVNFFSWFKFIPQKVFSLQQGFKFCCSSTLLFIVFSYEAFFLLFFFYPILLFLSFGLFFKNCYVTYFTCKNMSIFIIIVHMSLFFICVYIHK